MLPEKILQINPLKKVVLGPEVWDRQKLLIFMDVYKLHNQGVAKGIGISNQYFCKLKKGLLPFEPFNGILTAYKNAVKASKIAEVKAYSREMIKHYRSFN